MTSNIHFVSTTMNLYPSSLNSARFLFLSSSLILLAGLLLAKTDSIYIFEWQLLSLGPTPLVFPVVLDPIGTIFRSTVLFISANVILFATSYISQEPYLNRFIHLVLLFVLSINLLIFIPHIIILLLGWDGLGLISFLLVIYYQNTKSLAAGIITALMNRVGDVIILLRIGWTLHQGHWFIISISTNPHSIIIAITIIIAAITKRAQIPFSRWLPAAIAAPTPVSALVHSSTLVTAGVFLLIRFFPFLSKFSLFNFSLLLIATTTILIAGISALVECDIKKIIALSTLSQLGVIIIRLSLNLPTLAFFHLITHAMFKALLFICAGTLIHLHAHSQDLRFIGALSSQIPLSVSALLIANLALCGSPFIAGFYSKDLIIESSLFFSYNSLILIILLIATAITAAYSTRFFLSIIWSPINSNPLATISDEDIYSTNPIILLALAAITAGAFLNWLIVEPGVPIVIPISLKIIALTRTLTGLISSWILNSQSSTSAPLTVRLPLSHHFNASIWFLVALISQGVIKSPLKLSHKFLTTLDHGWLEILGPQGLYTSISSHSVYLTKWSSTSISTHLSVFALVIISLFRFFCSDNL